MDTNKSQQAQAVVKAKLIHTGTGDKFIWDTVAMIQVLQNKTDFNFSETLNAARYSWDEGIQGNGECILYSTSYPLGSQRLNDKNEWMLLNGKASVGVVCG